MTTTTRPLSHTAPNWDGDPATLTAEALHERIDAMAAWIANSVATVGREVRPRDLDSYRGCCDERTRRLGFVPHTWGRS